MRNQKMKIKPQLNTILHVTRLAKSRKSENTKHWWGNENSQAFLVGVSLIGYFRDHSGHI